MLIAESGVQLVFLQNIGRKVTGVNIYWWEKVPVTYIHTDRLIRDCTKSTENRLGNKRTCRLNCVYHNAHVCFKV